MQSCRHNRRSAEKLSAKGLKLMSKIINYRRKQQPQLSLCSTSMKLCTLKPKLFLLSSDSSHSLYAAQRPSEPDPRAGRSRHYRPPAHGGGMVGSEKEHNQLACCSRHSGDALPDEGWDGVGLRVVCRSQACRNH